MKYASKTDIGQRKNNEDACRLPKANDAYPLIAVSDGMGGHAAGALASSLVMEGLSRELPSLSLSDHSSSVLKKAVQRVNVEIYRRSRGDPSLNGMGATLVCALLSTERFIAACVGDSRLYHFDGNTLTQITCDHSFVEMLVQSGQITREEAFTHPQRNLITSAMGLSLRADIDVFEHRWKEGDLLLLCSDGLHGCVKDEALFSILMTDSSLEEKCTTMIELALTQGGMDNVTVALARCEEDES